MTIKKLFFSTVLAFISLLGFSQDYYWVQPNDTLEASLSYFYAVDPKPGVELSVQISKKSIHVGDASINGFDLTYIPVDESPEFDTVLIEIVGTYPVTIGGGFDTLGQPLPGDTYFAHEVLEVKTAIIRIAENGNYKKTTIREINDCKDLVEVEIEFLTPTYLYIFHELGDVKRTSSTLWNVNIKERQELIIALVYIPEYFLRSEKLTFTIERPEDYDSLFFFSSMILSNSLVVDADTLTFEGTKTPIGCLQFEKQDCDTTMVIVTNYKGCPSYSEVNFDTLIQEKDHWKYVRSIYKRDSGIQCFQEGLRPSNDTLYIPNMSFGDSLVYVVKSYKNMMAYPFEVDSGYHIPFPKDSLITILPVIEDQVDLRSDSTYKYQGEVMYTGKNDAGDCRTILSQEKMIVEAIELYPNPTSSILNLTKKVDVIDVFDITGQYILSAKQVKSIDVSALAVGMYVVRILNEGEFITLRFKKL